MRFPLQGVQRASQGSESARARLYTGHLRGPGSVVKVDAIWAKIVTSMSTCLAVCLSVRLDVCCFVCLDVCFYVRPFVSERRAKLCCVCHPAARMSIELRARQSRRHAAWPPQTSSVLRALAVGSSRVRRLRSVLVHLRFATRVHDCASRMLRSKSLRQLPFPT